MSVKDQKGLTSIDIRARISGKLTYIEQQINRINIGKRFKLDCINLDFTRSHSLRKRFRFVRGRNRKVTIFSKSDISLLVNKLTLPAKKRGVEINLVAYTSLSRVPTPGVKN